MTYSAINALLQGQDWRFRIQQILECGGAYVGNWHQTLVERTAGRASSAAVAAESEKVDRNHHLDNFPWPRFISRRNAEMLAATEKKVVQRYLENTIWDRWSDSLVLPEMHGWRSYRRVARIDMEYEWRDDPLSIADNKIPPRACLTTSMCWFVRKTKVRQWFLNPKVELLT